MMVSPDTNIKILRGVPLSKSYEHTVYYPNATEQENAFSAYTAHSLANYSYQRAGLGTIRVNLPYSQVYNCNYLMFRNTSYENKMFYAFITGASYVSESVSEIYYDIDVLQTFCYDYEFLTSFVERYHPKTDIIYQNTQPEGLELGQEYFINARHDIDIVYKDDNQKHFIVIATTSPTGDRPQCDVKSNTVVGIYRVECVGVDSVKSVVQQYINNGYGANIISIYTVASESVNSTGFKRKTDINGYTPKNKKLYSYPFCFIEMNNRIGDVLELKYENFVKQSDNNISPNTLNYSYKFIAFNSLSPTIPSSRLFPVGYMSPDFTPTDGFSVGYELFPIGAVADDSFKAWLAQNQYTYAASLNAVQQNYDTNQAIAQLNYTMAERNANAGLSSSSASIQTTLTNAQLTNNTASAINERNNTVAQGIAATKNMAGVTAGAASLDVGKTIDASISLVTDAISIQNQTQNTADTLATQLVTAGNSANTAMANAKLAYSTAMKNAATSQYASTLSNLTSANVATAQLVAKKQDAMHQPSNMRGQLMTCSFNTATDRIGYSVNEKCIKHEYAEMIDDYFEKYGYAYRRAVKMERTPTRPHWSYVKMVGCAIKGNLNAQDVLAIQGIYNNGVTTWRKLEEVGNYTLDNHEGVLEEQ